MEKIERWKPVHGFEDLYEVSDQGRVRSLKRATTNGKLLKGVLDKDGYIRVHLSAGKKGKTIPVHRLVAIAFVPGRTEEKSIVNHLNENKVDNRASNLEWCTSGYNTRYGGGISKRAKKRRIPIQAISKEGIWSFESITEASSKLGISHGNISGCILGYRGRKTAKGYTFAKG